MLNVHEGLGLGFETWWLRSQDLKANVSVLVSRPEGQGLGLGLETWSPRSRSRDLKAQVSVLVSRPEGQCLKTWRPRSRSWSRDLMAQVLVLVSRTKSSGLGFGLKTSWPRSRSQDLKAQVSVLVSRPEGQGLGLGLETWRSRSRSCLKTWSPRSRSWDLKKVLITTLADNDDDTGLPSQFQGTTNHPAEKQQYVYFCLQFKISEFCF